MKVLRAGAARAADLARLHALAFPAGWSASEIAALLEGPGVSAHVIECGGSLAGFILSRKVADEAEVLTLAVAPERRRRGLGAALLAHAAREARAAGAARLFLEVASDNLAALGLYGKAGLEKMGTRKAYYERQGGADALTLALDLNR